MCNMEEFQVELSRKIVLWQIFIGHVFMHCLGSFLLQDMLLNHHEFVFEGQNMI